MLHLLEKLGHPSQENEHLEHLNLCIAVLTAVQIFLMIATWMALTPVCSGWPPKTYLNMIAQGPDSMQEVFENADRWRICGSIRRPTVVTCILLCISQLLKLVYFTLLMIGLFHNPEDVMLYANLFEITSLGTLLGAFIVEIAKWFKLYNSVSAQAEQQPQKE